MKRFILFTIALALLAIPSLRAQNTDYVIVDSLVYTPFAAVDSTMSGESIYSVMPASVSIHQSAGVRSALSGHISRNADKMVTGYRVRIFFDNKQNSRDASAAAMARFRNLYPNVSAYRSFANPFFKVTVGDYRTRAEAQSALKSIRQDFPTAFIVKEKFKYPCLP